VVSLAVEPMEAPEPASSLKPLWEVALEIGASVPDEEWAKIPTDLGKNLHHYLYGAPNAARTVSARRSRGYGFFA